MKKLIYFALFAALVFIGCNKENVVEEPVLSGKTIELVGVMPEVTAPGGTRVLFDYTDGGQILPLNSIVFKWEVGDKVQLCFAQNGNIWNGPLFVGTVTRVEDNGKTCYFNLPIPTGLNVNSDYMIYGAAGGTQAGGAEFIENTTTIKSKNSVGDQHFALTGDPKENAILVFKKQMPEGMFTRVEFKHIGAFLALRVYNTSTTGEILHLSEATLSSANNWYYGGIINYDIANDVATQVEKTTAKFVPVSPMTINPHQNTGLIWQWIVPYSVATGPLTLKIGTTEQIISSKTLQAGKYYRITRNWDGVFGGVYGTKFCTNKQGEGVVKIKATFGTGGAWVDMNENGFQDVGDINILNGGNYDLYLPPTPRPFCYTIYGELTGLKVSGNKQNVIISAITNSPFIDKLELSENEISYDALYDLLLSLPDRSSNTPGYINLRNNIPNFDIVNYLLNSGTYKDEINQLLTSKNWRLVEQNPDIITG